jgi:hypothetical protein
MVQRHYIGQDFDFSEAMKPFAPFLDGKHFRYDPNRNDAAFVWLNMPQFPEYIAHCFSDSSLWSEIEQYQNEVENKKRASIYIDEMELYKAFGSASFRVRNQERVEVLPRGNALKSFPIKKLPEGKLVRRQTVYPLSHDETELVMDFLHRHEDFEYTMMAIKMCLLDYFFLMKEALKGKYDLDMDRAEASTTLSGRKIHTGYKALRANAVDFSMLQDLMPIIANRIRQHDESFSQKSLQWSFADAFHRQAFESSKNGEYSKCPFAQALVKLMSIEVKPSEEGKFTAHEKQYPGALIASMRNHIRGNYLQALSPKHQVHKLNPFYAAK